MALFAKREEPEPERAYLWPDCAALWGYWVELQTEWRYDMAGGSHFDFAGMRAYLDELGLAGEERREAVDAIRQAVQAVLEERALAAKKRAQQRPKR